MTDDFTRQWHAHRAYLVNVCYQMLGDLGDAEDVVQEAFARLARARDVEDARGWLTVVAGRLCLDVLRSARVRREQVLADGIDDRLSGEPDPADRVTLDDEVSAALLEVLRRLTPGERVVFVLHDVFGTPFDQIAATVGRPAGTCRQLARRARLKFAEAPSRLAVIDQSQHRTVTQTFIDACAHGDLDALSALLDPSVWGAGKILGAQAPPQINRGPDQVAANLLRYLGPDTTLVAAATSPTVLIAARRRRVFALINLTVRDGVICAIEATVDPIAAFPDPPAGTAQ
ncbi:RNA polymerase sigma factor SigI [Mycolicibacterium sp. 018/SC-01/001]|uniref:RNA polymerase sigma factor SigI n=1 Tax=Mycolicibacterium sp. 018/SC-01/001 TaxID=2592069 RepID=UPI001180FA45|nr:RNA polymerase sigma factor SigI [Mycolicibacterium sp. 018/SC-01/001]TRW80700.1 RNA polymerase sigma factor SigI [Mycolicibacterium sp. 018/SC-01/001]